MREGEGRQRGQERERLKPTQPDGGLGRGLAWGPQRGYEYERQVCGFHAVLQEIPSVTPRSLVRVCSAQQPVFARLWGKWREWAPPPPRSAQGEVKERSKGPKVRLWEGRRGMLQRSRIQAKQEIRPAGDLNWSRFRFHFRGIRIGAVLLSAHCARHHAGDLDFLTETLTRT